MSGDKKERVDALLSALTSRQPGKRQIKPVDTSMLQLFEDMDDDTDSEYVADDSGDSGDEEEEDDDAYEPCGGQSEDDNEPREDSGSESDIDSDDEKNAPLTNNNKLVNNIDENSVAPSVNSSLVDGKDTQTEEETPKVQRKSAEAALNNIPKSSSPPYSTTLSETKRHKQNILICMFCLSDENYINNELIECDSCGICVHENCYGMSDIISISSTGSSSNTEPWFCEACLAGEKAPMCQLCPELGGIFKRTDMNQWVHLICALYTPGVAFNDVDQLTSVTLTELSPKEWSSKECSLCEDKFYAWTGVCISCDAGLCRSFFHVTCAQKHGFLSEPNNEENSADPYFAQCRQHSDKMVVKHRRRNLLTAMTRQRYVLEQRGLMEKDKARERVARKLNYQFNKYDKWFSNQPQPYAPEVKVPQFIETNPAAMRLFLKKATNLGLPIDLTVQQATDSQKSGITGVPVFSPDFIFYFIDREKKIDSLSSRLSELEHLQRKLHIDDGNSSHMYNRCTNKREEVKSKLASLREEVNKLWSFIFQLNPDSAKSEALEELLCVEKADPVTTMESELPTVAAIVRDRRYGITSKKSAAYLRTQSTNCHQLNEDNVGEARDRSEDQPDEMTPKTVVINECQICRGLHDQHLLILCDTCAKYFHLACLEPPLTRMPKKTKLYGWQCSWCTKALTTDSDEITVDVDAPRRLRKAIQIMDSNNLSESAEPVPTITSDKPASLKRNGSGLIVTHEEENMEVDRGLVNLDDIDGNENFDTGSADEKPKKKKSMKRKRPSPQKIPKKVAKVNINPMSRSVKSIRTSLYAKPNRKRVLPAKFRDTSPCPTSLGASLKVKPIRSPTKLSSPTKRDSFTLNKKPSLLSSLKIPKISSNKLASTAGTRSPYKTIRPPPVTMTVASKDNPPPPTFQGNPRDPRLKHQQESSEQFQRIVQMLGQQKQKQTSTSISTKPVPTIPSTNVSSLLRYPMSDQNYPGETVRRPIIIPSIYQPTGTGSQQTSPSMNPKYSTASVRISPNRRQAAIVAISAVRGEPLPTSAQMYDRNIYHQDPDDYYSYGTSSNYNPGGNPPPAPPCQPTPSVSSDSVVCQAATVNAPSSVFSSTSDDDSVTSSEGNARASSKCSSNSIQDQREYKICSNKNPNINESSNKLTIKVLKNDCFSVTKE